MERARCAVLPSVAGLLCLAVSSGCSSSTGDESGYIRVTTGQEADAWSADPAPQSVRVDLIGGSESTIATVPAPLTQLSLGTGGPSNTVTSFQATAFDADDNPVMGGVSVPFYLQTFSHAEVPLFMGRIGGFSRPPGTLSFRHHHPSVTVVYHAILLIAGGDATDVDPTSLDIYDMSKWLATGQQPALPLAPQSWAAVGTDLLLINELGTVWLDLSTNLTHAATNSTAYVAVAGGQTLLGPNDEQYIVGPTRKTGAATNTVLRINTDETIQVLKLATPRLAAAAAIVEGQLLVSGGADSGAGAEVLTADGMGFTALPFPADATQGAAMTELDASTVVLAGGVDPVSGALRGFRTLDPGCSDQCKATDIPKIDFGLSQPQLFSLSDKQLLAVGESEDGETHVFTLDKSIGYQLTERALRVPRASASAALLPNGQIGVFGGDALDDGSSASSIEIFFSSL